jgi:hypothetical protein
VAKNNLENEVWVETTLNDMMAHFDIGTPPLESTREHMSLTTKEELYGVTLLEFQVRIPKENSLLMSLHACRSFGNVL